jgi:hypothetical protein
MSGIFLVIFDLIDTDGSAKYEWMIDIINWTIIFRAIRFYYPFLYSDYKFIPDTISNFYKIVSILAQSLLDLGYTMFIGMYIFI